MNKNNNMGRFILVAVIILWALFEVMPVTDDIRDAVTAAESAATIRGIVRSHGVRSLRDSGISMATQGLTTLEEVLRVAQME